MVSRFIRINKIKNFSFIFVDEFPTGRARFHNLNKKQK